MLALWSIRMSHRSVQIPDEEGYSVPTMDKRPQHSEEPALEYVKSETSKERNERRLRELELKLRLFRALVPLKKAN